MPKYAVAWTKSSTEDVASLAHANCSATVRRGRVYDLTMACTATPADATFVHVVRRSTAVTTGNATQITPAPLDVADAAALASVYSNTSADTTSFQGGLSLLRIPLNHRATFRWVASPGGELVWPASTGFGVTFGLTTCSANSFGGVFHYEE